MNLDDLPIIDWEQGAKLAGNNKQLAKDLLDMLVTNLATDVAAIKSLHTHKQQKELLQQVHKLHGALCYCGLPRLKEVISCMEIALKKDDLADLPIMLTQLDTEVGQLLHIFARK